MDNRHTNYKVGIICLRMTKYGSICIYLLIFYSILIGLKRMQSPKPNVQKIADKSTAKRTSFYLSLSI